MMIPGSVDKWWTEAVGRYIGEVDGDFTGPRMCKPEFPLVDPSSLWGSGVACEMNTESIVCWEVPFVGATSGEAFRELVGNKK